MKQTSMAGVPAMSAALLHGRTVMASEPLGVSLRGDHDDHQFDDAAGRMSLRGLLIVISTGAAFWALAVLALAKGVG